MQLPNLQLLQLTFRLQAQASVILPPYLGSTLRGSLGTALQKTFCYMPYGERCRLREDCPYLYIFESPNLIPRERSHSLLRGHKSLPRPFVLVPPDPLRKSQRTNKSSVKYVPNFNEDYRSNHFLEGDVLEFSIILMGKTIPFWLRILFAVELFAKNGLGKERVPFLLSKAFSHNSYGQTIEIFDAAKSNISSSGVEPVSLGWLAGLRTEILKKEIEKKNKYILKVSFQIPSRISIGKKVKTDLTFYELIKKITERLEFLAQLHAQTEQRIDYRPILPAENEVILVENNLHKYIYEQYSNNLEGKTRREIITGTAVFKGRNIFDYLPFLAAGELLNVGSNTSAGMGKFTVETVSDFI